MYAKGHVLSIPMPGHPPNSDEETLQTLYQLSELEDLVKEHDALFLLTDTRESRWLPTLLGQVYGKIVMNAALGFDSYLVMRHGVYPEGVIASQKDAIVSAGKDIQKNSIDLLTNHASTLLLEKMTSIPRLGCYFCADIVAPSDVSSIA